MVTGQTGLPDIFADVDLVVEGYQPAVCIELDPIGKGWHGTPGFPKGKTLANVAGIAFRLYLHGLVAFDTVGPNKTLVGWSIALELTGLSVIVAGAAAHFGIPYGGFLIKIVMTIIAIGKSSVVGMIEDHITSGAVKPYLLRSR